MAVRYFKAALRRRRAGVRVTPAASVSAASTVSSARALLPPLIRGSRPRPPAAITAAAMPPTPKKPRRLTRDASAPAGRLVEVDEGDDGAAGAACSLSFMGMPFL